MRDSLAKAAGAKAVSTPARRAPASLRLIPVAMRLPLRSIAFSCTLYFQMSKNKICGEESRMATSIDEARVMRRVFRRIVPLCFLLYIISYIERANIGYAALQMNAELGLSPDAFGFAAGIFF